MEKNNKKVIRSWAMYDWANSVYSLTITSAIFPIYYQNVAVSESGSNFINFLGYQIENSVLYTWSLSFSFLLVAAIQPLLSGVADYSGKKKLFMMIFMYIGAISCIGLFFFEGDNIEWGILCSILASVGYSGSLVFYDAFLPEIATEDRFDFVSAKGFALGYIGSVILLIINLVMIQFPDIFFGVESKATELIAANPSFLPAEAREQAVSHYTVLSTKISFLSVGIWWIVFSQIPNYYLPSNVYQRKVEGNIFFEGYNELTVVWQSLKSLPMIKFYLLSFFFYNMGVQTVMYLAATFGKVVIQLEDGNLIAIVLVIQLVAVGGAYLFAKVSKIKGNKIALVIMITTWILICVYAYFTYTATQFFILAFFVGMVMGGIQSLSRSTYSKLIPTNTIDHTSYFSFYDVTYNLSIVVGTFSYGWITQATGDMRNTVLALALFFVIGMTFLYYVKVPDIHKVNHD